MDELLRDIGRSIELADAADVLAVAAVFFVAITLLRRSSSGIAARRVAALAFLGGAVYLLADVFALYLMGRLLEVLFFVFLVAAAVAFQSDIRRLLDRMASWSFGRRPAADSLSRPAETVVEAAVQLSQTRTGALIAVQGREPWESHIQGGVELDGVISVPLLVSIFHPGTPGHDGAVLIEGDRICRFAAHLPLATHLPEASRYGGTRHAAALGLAEECDAFVIVVSEERGTISVAHEGVLTETESGAELGELLDRFWREHYPDPLAPARVWRNRRTLESAGMALGLAASAWLFLSFGADTVHRTYEVPIEFRNLPPEWVVDSDSVPTVLVTVAGSEPAFGRLDPGSLAVSFDLKAPRQGTNRLPITQDDLEIPSGLYLHDVNPREVSVVARRQTPLRLPVEIRAVRPRADSLSPVPEPRAVTVFVSAEAGRLPDRVPTELVDLRRMRAADPVRVKLALSPEMRLHPEEPAEVTVTLLPRAGANRPGAASVP